MRRTIFLSFIALVLISLVGCQQLSNPEEGNLELAPVVEQQAALGWQINRMVSSGNEIEGLTQSSQYFEEESPDLPNSANLKLQAKTLKKSAAYLLSSNYAASKTNGDSLIYFRESYIGGKGKRVAVYYFAETGKARIYEVYFQYPEWSNFIYDSTEVVFDLNFTIWDNSDDRVESLYKIQNFKETFAVQSILATVQVTDWEGAEISGGIVTKDAYYHSSRFLSHLHQQVELNPDSSGSLREDLDFRDGSAAYTMVTFNADNTGSFSKKRRDGTVISGEFDSVEDDLEGYYKETTDFPEGRYIDKISKSAIVSITLPDSIFNADFSEIVYFKSGRIDSSSASIRVWEQDGVKTTVLEQSKPNGAHGKLTIVEKGGESTLEGTWTSRDGYFIIVSAEYYIDGSSHLHYEVYAPPYTPGDDPIIIADYYFSPDQTGNGTITHNGNTYQVNFSDTGQAKISLDNKSKNINLFK